MPSSKFYEIKSKLKYKIKKLTKRKGMEILKEKLKEKKFWFYLQLKIVSIRSAPKEFEVLSFYLLISSEIFENRILYLFNISTK